MQKHNSHTCYSHTRKTAAGDCGTTRVIATVCNELADELPLKWFLHATLVFQDGDPPEPHRSEAATEYSTKKRHICCSARISLQNDRRLATLNVIQEYTQNRKTNQTRVVAKKCTADEVRSLTQIDCNIIIIIR